MLQTIEANKLIRKTPIVYNHKQQKNICDNIRSKYFKGCVSSNIARNLCNDGMYVLFCL